MLGVLSSKERTEGWYEGSHTAQQVGQSTFEHALASLGLGKVLRLVAILFGPVPC